VDLNVIKDLTKSLTFSKLLIFRQKKDYSMTKSLNLGHSVDANSLADMSKSLAGFHLTAAGGAGNKAMHESTMDQVLFGLYSFCMGGLGKDEKAIGNGFLSNAQGRIRFFCNS
jgi:hypothetical protein